MRDFLQKFGIYIGIALIAIAVLVYFLNRSSGPVGGNTALAFFVDENDLSYETVRPFTDYPPIVEKGRTLVRAVKRSDDEGKTVYIAFLLKYSPEVQKALKDNAQMLDPHFDRMQQAGTFVRSPKANSWIKASDEQARELMNPAPNATGKLPLTINPSR